MKAPYSPRAGEPRLHVNIDHVATLRQARRGCQPDPLEFALECIAAGAAGITVHLRKDRRHIQDGDLPRLRAGLSCFLNLELSLDPEIVAIALKSGADGFCLVPENRQEVTTEGGLDVIGERRRLAEVIPRLQAAGGLVSLFVDPDLEQIRACRELAAEFIELHTGSYANAQGEQRQAELKRLRAAAACAHDLGLRINAGHGLDGGNVEPIAQMPHVEELNIGFSIVAESLSCGVRAAVQRMLEKMASAQAAQRAEPRSQEQPVGGVGALRPTHRMPWPQASAGQPRLALRLDPGLYEILQGPIRSPLPNWLHGPIWSMTSTPEEVSIVCPAKTAPEVLPSGWCRADHKRLLRFVGPLPLEAVGILADLSAALAQAGVPIFAVSTFNTDWILVDQAKLAAALGALRAAGYALQE